MKRLCMSLRLPLTLLGLAAFFVNERYFSAHTHFVLVRALALGLIFLSVLDTLWVSWRSQAGGLRGEGKSFFYASFWQVALLVGLCLYLLYQRMLGDAAAPQTHTAKLLLGSWLVLVTLSLSAATGLEWALRRAGHGEFAEPSRVGRAGVDWLMVGMVLGIVVCLNFVGAKTDRVRDWSYLKTTVPGEATRSMIRTLQEPLQVRIFFPATSEVRPLVEEYFAALAATEPRVEITSIDKDLDPIASEKYHVTVNGQVILEHKGTRERIDVGLTLAAARSTLAKFDQSFQKAFLQLTADRKTIYFTQGHGEMSWQDISSSDPFRSLRLLESGLRGLNLSLKFLGGDDQPIGSQDIPGDAGLVVIIGPKDRFLPGEVDSLRRFLESGGTVLTYFDLPSKDERTPEFLASNSSQGGDPLKELYKEAGIEFHEEQLANDQVFYSANRGPADHTILITQEFGTHESIQTLAKNDRKVQVVAYGSGYFTVLPQSPTGWQAAETLRTHRATFVDKNRNFAFDEKAGEHRRMYAIGAAAELKHGPRKADTTGADQDAKDAEPVPSPEAGDTKPKSGRLIAFADSALISDALIPGLGNRVLVGDTLNWAIGRVEAMGQVASEEDVKIQHTKNEDVVWFYGTVTIVPMLLLGGGYLATRRRRRRSA